MKNYSIIIAGAGIIGLTLARKLKQSGHKNILILEKENRLGVHASGRNSGVLHAGIYYGSDTQKAKVCVQGKSLMEEYALENKIPLKHLGKVIVAQSPDQISQVEFLFERAKSNGVEVQLLNESELKEVEPYAFTVDRALYSPKTSVIDSNAVLESLHRELLSQGIQILTGEQVVDISAQTQTLHTQNHSFGFDHFVNCAGLQADRLAHWMGVGLEYHILPFRGAYRKLTSESAPRYRGSIYPVPDLRFPFLGVHITRSVHDTVMVGPTAMPALGRENYGLTENLNLSDLPSLFWNMGHMFVKNTDGMRNLVFDEITKYFDKGFLKAAQGLSKNLQASDLSKEGKVGLRAQLVNTQTKKLEMDFIVKKGPRSTHVLNAVSPAFTSSMAMAQWIESEMDL